jgi:heptosyltransferase-3
VLVLRPGALGDTLLALPALRALRRQFAPITLAAHAPTARLLEDLGEVDLGIAFDHPSLAWLFHDVVPEQPVVAWMSPSGAPALKRALLVAPSRPPDEHTHCAAYLLESLTPLGIDTTCDATPLCVDALESDEVLLHPGSGSPRKNWPAEHFATVIRSLTGPVRLVVGEADIEAAQRVEALAGHDLPRLSMTGLDHLARRLAGCRAYLGNDSGVSHLAGLCGARTVVLFGPTSPDVWRPLGPDVRVLPFESSTSEVVALLQPDQ